ncbi:hypothetical protein NHF50_05645 [Flavobacterium sp. NRK F10]|uniref:hypothetical protein n=1 Tax=Flavobacterium sp. NRK F10 TaxID=2954931 RepID=UPI002091CBE9|nr:hypothetical protein [Flavobacterium sp. NRK F10]MCO6174521.1 hypothetical protein [Flavobacterium sp. NRK F10]
MVKIGFIALFFLWFSELYAQETETPYKSKKIAVVKDTISLEKVSINKAFFKVKDFAGNEIDSTLYHVDFPKGKIIFHPNTMLPDSLEIRYLMFPDYITKEYAIYDDSKIVPNAAAGNLYSLKRESVTKFKPFDGLNTSGSISRGITIGNNQNTVVNSNLDLQITGKISDKVSLRASIQDSNIPLQDGGYSQKLDEFDQIFIELFSDNWSIRAGDLFLENRQSQFLNFNKKVQGLSTRFSFGKSDSKTEVYTAAAIVRGQYARSTFTGQEGNQGPYKLKGNNDELYVLVISGSERVYVNGILLERGENNDYVIDYNAGEVIFTSLFPITSEMRINVEYQYTDRNFTRIVTYGGVTHEREKFKIGTFLYSENDVKNQPLQQNLSEEQVSALQEAGDDQSLMNAPSAYLDVYSENKILYRVVTVGAEQIYEYSNDPNEELYNVRFTYIGENQGNYVISNSNAIGKIYEYVAPVNGVLQGDYEPIVRLIAPTKIQIATVLGSYLPSEKTTVDFEVAVSNNDQNLYSTIDDNNNKGVAVKIDGKQRLYTGKFNLDLTTKYDFVQQDFKTIERLYNIEFNRDWNISTVSGNQSLLQSGLNFNFFRNGFVHYQFEKLDFSKNFSGNRHLVESNLKFNKTAIVTNFSAMNSQNEAYNSKFIRNQSKVLQHIDKNWVGATFNIENNRQKNSVSDEYTALSQRFTEYGFFAGRGDSTNVYVEIGYKNRANDSLVNNTIERVNQSHSYYLKSQLIKTEKSNLSIYFNYRNLKYKDEQQPKQTSLNSRLLYTNSFFSNLIQSSTIYETTSGTIPQQEFTYLEVDPGQGVYMWNDYNNNGIQEIQEFEIAPFSDQAKYVRVYLPNQVYVKTHQNKFSQSIIFNGLAWQNKIGLQKFLSKFYNQFSFLVERKIKKENSNFDLNPFSKNDNILGLNNNFRNSLFFNKGRQYHSVTYTYINNHAKSLLNVGSQENKSFTHQLQYAHLVAKMWLLKLVSQIGNTKSYSENYSSRDYEIDNYSVSPKISYIFSKNASWDVFYEYKNQKNTINLMETLEQNQLGTGLTFNSEKGFTLNASYSFYNNKLTGDSLSPVSFQMLQGLQAGKNSVWQLVLQKNITQYLDININYQGRRSETSKAVHTGNVQLRAFF